MEKKNLRVLPHKYYWFAVLFLTLLSVSSFLTFEYGWILFIFSVLLYLLGRGKQERNDGLTVQ